MQNSILDVGAGQRLLKRLPTVNNNYLILFVLSGAPGRPAWPACSTCMPQVMRFDTGNMCPSQRRRLQRQQTNAKCDLLIVPNNILSPCQKLLGCTFVTSSTGQIVTPVLACIILHDSSKVVPRRRINHGYRPTDRFTREDTTPALLKINQSTLMQACYYCITVRTADLCYETPISTRATDPTLKKQNNRFVYNDLRAVKYST